MTLTPNTRTLPDGSTWPTPAPEDTGISWKLRYRHPRDLTAFELGQAADTLDAYARLVNAPPQEREGIVAALNGAPTADTDER